MSRVAAVNEKMVMGFGQVLLNALQAKHVSRAELATRTDVTYDAIVKITRGERPPTLRTVGKLASALNLTITQLLTGEFG